jgi:hypothetical protein
MGRAFVETVARDENHLFRIIRTVVASETIQNNPQQRLDIRKDFKIFMGRKWSVWH